MSHWTGRNISRKSINLDGLNSTAIDLIRKGALKKSSSKTYKTAWKSFANFCNASKSKPDEAASIANWMAELNKTGINQRSIRTYCVAVCSTIETATTKGIGQERFIELTLKTLKVNGNKSYKNKSMWDVQVALEKLRTLSTASLYELSQKAAFLLALCTCWRPGSDLARIQLDTVKFMEDGSVEVQAFDTKEGGTKALRLKPFPDKRICPVEILNQYIKQTVSLRTENSKKLFISKKGKDASGDTIRRWIKELFPKLDIDVNKFRPHSTRATASSTLLLNGKKIGDVIRLGNWSSANVFKEYYLRSVVEYPMTPTNGIQELLQSPNEVLPSNNESSDVILSVIREKATATTPRPPSPKARKSQKRARVTPVHKGPIKGKRLRK